MIDKKNLLILNCDTTKERSVALNQFASVYLEMLGISETLQTPDRYLSEDDWKNVLEKYKEIYNIEADLLELQHKIDHGESKRKELIQVIFSNGFGAPYFLIDLKELTYRGINEKTTIFLKHIGVASTDDLADVEKFKTEFSHRFSSKKFGL